MCHETSAIVSIYIFSSTDDDTYRHFQDIRATSAVLIGGMIFTRDTASLRLINVFPNITVREGILHRQLQDTSVI